MKIGELNSTHLGSKIASPRLDGSGWTIVSITHVRGNVFVECENGSIRLCIVDSPQSLAQVEVAAG